MNQEKIKKSSKKQERAQAVLVGLIELYLETGKHIGSNTLRENGFEHLSPATIRNYFAQLEEEGLLEQAHTSGGRIPTHMALRAYAQDLLKSPFKESAKLLEQVAPLQELDKCKLSSYLALAAESLSEITGYATFLSSVRFDHDLIIDVRLLGLDDQRLLSVIITDFGQILTETLNIEKKMSAFTLKRIESYLQWRVKGGAKPLALSKDEESLALKLYNEIMVRYLVRYSNFSDEDIYRSGLSRLLAYPEFNDPVALATGLSLFENNSHMRLLLNDCSRSQDLQFWIGSDLAPYATNSNNCSVIAMGYHIGQTNVGAIGLLGPARMDYRTLFGTLNLFAKTMSKTLTETLYTHKITFRQPRSGQIYLEQQERTMIDQGIPKLLDIKEKS